MILFVILSIVTLSGKNIAFAEESLLTTNVSYGMRNNYEVLKLQQFLASQGLFTLAPTGNYFTATRAAVMAFQAQNGISMVGSVGPITRAKVNSIAAESSVYSGSIQTNTVLNNDRIAVEQFTNHTDNYPYGCASENGYSPLTGVRCNSAQVKESIKEKISIKKSVSESNNNANSSSRSESSKVDCQTVLNGVTYKLSPCQIIETMNHSDSEKPFSVDIIPSDRDVVYSIQRGEGENNLSSFIKGFSSGGAVGTTTLDFRFKPSVLSEGIYDTYIPISVSTTTSGPLEIHEDLLKIKINLTVR